MSAKTSSTRGAGRTTKATQQEERLDPAFAKAIRHLGDRAIDQLKAAVDREAAKRAKKAA